MCFEFEQLLLCFILYCTLFDKFFCAKPCLLRLCLLRLRNLERLPQGLALSLQAALGHDLQAARPLLQVLNRLAQAQSLLALAPGRLVERLRLQVQNPQAQAQSLQAARPLLQVLNRLAQVPSLLALAPGLPAARPLLPLQVLNRLVQARSLLALGPLLPLQVLHPQAQARSLLALGPLLPLQVPSLQVACPRLPLPVLRRPDHAQRLARFRQALDPSLLLQVPNRLALVHALLQALSQLAPPLHHQAVLLLGAHALLQAPSQLAELLLRLVLVANRLALVRALLQALRLKMPLLRRRVLEAQLLLALCLWAPAQLPALPSSLLPASLLRPPLDRHRLLLASPPQAQLQLCLMKLSQLLLPVLCSSLQEARKLRLRNLLRCCKLQRQLCKVATSQTASRLRQILDYRAQQSHPLHKPAGQLHLPSQS